VGLVGNQKWALPPVWLGDKKNVDEQSGKELVFGDEATAGRQLFRVAYSVVAGVTLGFSFASFQAVQLASPVLDWTVPLNSSPPARALLFACAVGSLAVSLASLKNPSPLSLVPGFEPDEDAPLGLRRDDSLKLRAYGLTRVTRHPLILPVVPWGVRQRASDWGPRRRRDPLSGPGPLRLGRLLRARLTRVSSCGSGHRVCERRPDEFLRRHVVCAFRRHPRRQIAQPFLSSLVSLSTFAFYFLSRCAL